MTPRAKAVLAARACASKKGERPVVLDMSPLAAFTDYFCIASGRASVQVRAMAEAVHQELKKAGAVLSHREGTKQARWVLMDYGDVIVHIFDEETRNYYQLEKMWGDARKVSWVPRKRKGSRK